MRLDSWKISGYFPVYIASYRFSLVVRQSQKYGNAKRRMLAFIQSLSDCIKKIPLLILALLCGSLSFSAMPQLALHEHAFFLGLKEYLHFRSQSLLHWSNLFPIQEEVQFFQEFSPKLISTASSNQASLDPFLQTFAHCHASKYEIQSLLQ